jgi:hypothetical protein
MKKSIIRIVLVTLLLVACGSTPVMAGGGEPLPPFCPPWTTCTQVHLIQRGGSEPLPPFCPPGYTCD